VTTGETLNCWYKKFQEYSGVEVEKIQEKLNNLAEGEPCHPDSKLISWVTGELEEKIPKLSTDFWRADANADNDAKLDAEFEEWSSKKELKESNNRLEDAMDTDGGDSMNDYIGKRISHEIGREISNRRREIRKKLFGRRKRPGVCPHRRWSRIRKEIRAEFEVISKEVSATLRVGARGRELGRRDLREPSPTPTTLRIRAGIGGERLPERHTEGEGARTPQVDPQTGEGPRRPQHLMGGGQPPRL
jgi:hypothetical protein